MPWRLLFLCVGILLVPPGAAADENRDDTTDLSNLEILLKLYDDAHGFRWDNHTNWLVNTDVCTWFGVSCYESTVSDQRRVGHVRQLDLSDNHLVGSVPPELYELPYLESLLLGGNSDLQVAFDGIANAQFMKELSISEVHVDSFEGIQAAADHLEVLHMTKMLWNQPFPAQVLALTSLQELYANYNGMVQTLPTEIGRLSRLQSLYLYDNDMTGDIPTEIGLLTDLVNLVLGQNAYSGVLPTQLDQLTDLELLAIQREAHEEKGLGITGNLPSLANAPRLKEVYFQNQLLLGSIPNDFLASASVSDIVTVDLTANALTGSVPTELLRITRLELLLAQNHITDLDLQICQEGLDWMGGQVGQTDCTAFLCPPQFSSSQGRRTEDEECQDCPQAQYYGSTECSTPTALLNETDTAVGLTEREILIEFYNRMGGRYWKRSDNWLNLAVDVCNWYGIACDSQGHVTEFNLPNNDLTNAPPTEIFSLPELRKLNFHANSMQFDFTGSHTATKLEILDLTHTDLTSLNGIDQLASTPIKTLLLASNYLQDGLPDELFSLVTLEELDISHNRFYGTLPTLVGNLVSLEKLHIYGNQLTGQLPTQVGQLGQLREFLAAENKFDGTLPTQLNQLNKLQSLSLHQTTSSHGIGGPLLAFEGLERLTSLQLDSNNLEGNLPEQLLSNTLKGSDRIEVLLSDNNLVGTIPVAWGNTFDDLFVDLTGNMIDDDIDDNLCLKVDWMDGAVGAYGCDAILCPSGTYNDLGRQTGPNNNCRVCSSPRAFLGSKECGSNVGRGEYQILMDLYDSTHGNNWNNNTGWTTSHDYCNEWFGVQCGPDGKVHTIDLRTNGLTGVPTTSIYELPSLKRLYLTDNQIGMDFAGIAQATSLELLHLTNIGLDSVAGIGAATSLVALHLTENDLAGPFPDELLALTNLEHLYMNYNRITGRFPDEIGRLSLLQELYLFHNQLTGQLPAAIGGLTDLEVLVLGSNDLSGTLPPELNDLTSISLLSLQRGEDDTVPALVGRDQVSGRSGRGFHGPLLAFDKLEHIAQLYLGMNQLTGEIPFNFLDGVADKTTHIEVDLISNRLTGALPASLSQFEHLTIYAAGNEITDIAPGLCLRPNWMGGLVSNYSCDAILCPENTYSEYGRQADGNSDCVPCPGGEVAPYMGSFDCLDSDEHQSFGERRILEDFYTAMDGDSWRINTNWMDPNESICNWYGVNCFNGDEEKVVSIHLPRNLLEGSVPDSIFQLSDMREISLAGNNIQIDFSNIGDAADLMYLNLDYTGLTSLQGLGAAENLTLLHLIGNDFTSFPTDIFQLSLLEALYISENSFSSLPDELGSLSNLVFLSASNIGLTGPIPGWISNLTKLEYLRLDTNSLEGGLSDQLLMNLVDLKHLDLSDQTTSGGAGLSGNLPDFTGLAQLTELFLQRNSFSGSLQPTFLRDVDNSEPITVDLRWNQLTGSIPPELDRIVDMDIYLSDNMIDTPLSPEICATTWNGDNGCDGILCPIGFFSAFGRATASLGCVPCTQAGYAQYLGSTECGPDHEKTILTDLFLDLNGPDWGNVDNWLDYSDVCTWYGITCYDSGSLQGYVKSVELGGNNLVGNVNASIWQLEHMTDLDLRNNDIDISFQGIDFALSLESLQLSETSVTTLSGIGAATSLRALHLTNNDLGGPLPDELFDLTNLERLYLNYNNFASELPIRIGELTMLKELYLFHNNLEGSLPTQIGELDELVVLALGENLFTGTIPTELNNLRALEVLSLQREFDLLDTHNGSFVGVQPSDHGLHGQLPAFVGLRNLRELYLAKNGFHSEIPGDFLILNRWKNETITVDLTGNLLSGTIPSSLRFFDDLRLLLAGNQIQEIPPEICAKAEWFDGGMASGCDALLCQPGTFNEFGRRVSDDTPCQPCTFHDPTHWQQFYGSTSCGFDSSLFDDRRILGRFFQATDGPGWQNSRNWMVDNTTICSWYGITCAPGTNSVSRIDLPSNMLRGDVPSHIFHLPSLEFLNLEGNDVQISLGEINEAPLLQELNLGSIRATVLDGIQGATSLTSLTLSSTPFLGRTIPEELYELSGLVHLDVSNCGFSGILSSNVGQLVNLENLNLEGNDLYGQIPHTIGQMSAVESLILSENNFFGTLPQSMNNLMNLRQLMIDASSRNGSGITGPLPSFENAPALSELRLASNSLTGSLPQSFLEGVTAVDQVVTVDLSSNRITGIIPQDLTRFSRLNLDLTDNLITGISPPACSEPQWLGGAVDDFGCDGILCPAGTFNQQGRQTSIDTPCEACPGAESSIYMGRSICASVEKAKERRILENLYDATGGPNWKNRHGWTDPSVDVCDWFGISCRGGATVDAINLGSNNLVGTPPPELFDLPNLEFLWLYSNPIDFSFQGIQNATSLASLLLDSTGLTSLEGIGSAPALKNVDVRFNSISGGLPVELRDLSTLQSFSCSNNLLTGRIPDFSQNYKLSELRLSNNRLTGPVPSFSVHTDMVSLDVSGNTLSGSIPRNLFDSARTSSSIFIDLSENILTGTVPGELSRFDDLTLYLRDNRLEAIHPGLCSKAEWNDGDVGNFMCDGLLCPPNTYAPNTGRASRDGYQCQPCDDAKYFGTSDCGGDRSSALSSRGAFVLSVIATLVVTAVCLRFN